MRINEKATADYTDFVFVEFLENRCNRLNQRLRLCNCEYIEVPIQKLRRQGMRLNINKRLSGRKILNNKYSFIIAIIAIQSVIHFG